MRERFAHKLSAIFGRAACGRRGLARIIFVYVCALVLPLFMLASRATPLSSEAEGAESERTEVNAPTMQGGNYSTFSHIQPMHARLPCLLCHRREDNNPRPKLPGHSPCAGCHAQQFNDSSSPICTICHTSPPSSALKAFPSLKSFNARFDHARHAGTGCTNCHRSAQRGVALSIPAGLGAHTTCFQCHSPRAQGTTRGDISSCGTCHQLGRLVRTPATSRAYRINFSHARHGARQRLSCNSCHQVLAGRAQGQQVTAPLIAQHFASTRAQSCMTCHNGKRAFGGDLSLDCKRCHRGTAFGF